MPEQRRTSHSIGLEGEELAEAYLTNQGMLCIDRRYHSPYGEIDLIMLDGETLVCAEVKYRRFNTLLSAQAAVTPAKQRKLIQTALVYLNEHPEYADCLIRFDVISISGNCIQHIPDAFQATGW